MQEKFKSLKNESFYPDYESFLKNERYKITSLLNIFLDGDLNFIKENKKIYFSIECLKQLNDFLDNPDDDEFIEEFKNKNIDFIIENDDSCTYLLHIHRIINYLYFNKPLQSEVDINCTIELLTHRVYTNLKNSFKEFKLSVESKYIPEKTLFNCIERVKKLLFENTPYIKSGIYDDLVCKYNKKNTSHTYILDNINEFIKEVKKPYNLILIKNHKALMEHYQDTSEIITEFNMLVNKLQK